MIKDKYDLKYFLQEDAISLGIGKKGISAWLFPNPILKFQRTLRYLEYYSNQSSIYSRIVKLYYRVLYRRMSIKLGFSIPINVIDAGLSIAHYGTIVISPYAKIGKNCRIHACVNIGASTGNHKAPSIGDNVYIGPGALLFGDIEIANGITVGANATVNKSCLIENTVLAGTPAKIVKHDYPDWTEFNKRIKTS